MGCQDTPQGDAGNHQRRPYGVGRPQLAIALGREAIRQGYSVLFATAPAVMAADVLNAPAATSKAAL